MTALLLDTCAMIWIANGDPFNEQARKCVASAVENGRLFISPISAWEIGLLVRKNRLALTSQPENWFEAFLNATGIALTPMVPRMLVASSFLPGRPPNDPADRIIAATARHESLQVVTRDRKILDYADAGHIRALEC